MLDIYLSPPHVRIQVAATCPSHPTLKGARRSMPEAEAQTALRGVTCAAAPPLQEPCAGALGEEA